MPAPADTARITALEVLDDVQAAAIAALAPTVPELSAQMPPESLKQCVFPDGPVWVSRAPAAERIVSSS